MEKEFEGKAVIVTGSSAGIGLAIAAIFAKRGAMVTLCGRNEDRLKAAVETCQQAGSGGKDKYIYVRGDITDREVRKRILETTVQTFGRLDVLVCNHGIVARPASNSDEDAEDAYDKMMDTNVKSAYFLIEKAVPYLQKTAGNVVCIFSVSSTTVSFLSPAVYCMSKAAVDHMTRTLALQLAGKGIRVNAVNPTLVITNITKHHDPEKLSKTAETHPLYGRNSTPEEQAEVVAFLAGPSAGFVTGQCVKVDRGRTLLGSMPIKLEI